MADQDQRRRELSARLQARWEADPSDPCDDILTEIQELNATHADPWQEPTTKRWAESVLNEMAPKMAKSTFVMSLVPDDAVGDVKFWVETGAAICMDKPIIAVALGDAPIPRKLELVADEVVRLPEGVNPEASQALRAAMERMKTRLDDG